MTSIITQNQSPQPTEGASRDGRPQEAGVRRERTGEARPPEPDRHTGRNRVSANGPSYRGLNGPAGAAL